MAEGKIRGARKGCSLINYDPFIRSRQGQDLIELYAQSVGQKFQSKIIGSQISLVGSGG